MILCPAIDELGDHLSFDCSVSWEIWRRLLQPNRISREIGKVTSFLGLVNILKGKSLECLILKIAFNSCIYNIWKARNLALH